MVSVDARIAHAISGATGAWLAIIAGLDVRCPAYVTPLGESRGMMKREEDAMAPYLSCVAGGRVWMDPGGWLRVDECLMCSGQITCAAA